MKIIIKFSRHIKMSRSGSRPAFIKRWGLFLFLFTACSGLLSMSPTAHAVQRNSREYEIKTAFIYNFAKYVTWPQESFADKQVPLVLGLLGDNNFGKSIYKIDGKMVHGRKLKIRIIDDYEQIKECHLLYISPSEKKKLNKRRSLLKTEKILTISDMGNFIDIGGIIELIVKEGKVKFIINPKAAERAGLDISSQLLKLAIITKTKF